MPDKDAKKAYPKIWLFTQTEDGHLVPIAAEAEDIVADIVRPPSPWWEDTKEYLALTLWREWFARGESPWIEGSCFFCKEQKTADEAAGHAPDCLYVRAKAMVEQENAGQSCQE
jgi:hypothetical protein